MARLEVSISEKRFRSAQGADLIAIRDLNFNLEANKFTCIVGPSGCGKTTTLRIILGLDREFDGDITNLSQRRTAAVFQEPRLIPWRTVRQNVNLCLEAAKIDTPNTATTSADDGQNSPERLAYLFRTLGLEDLLDFYPAELSLGLARRAALARAFAIQPNLLVLDEPFVSLDETTATRLRQLLLSVWESQPTTVLMVTHNVREAVQLADKVIVLSHRPSSVIDEIDIEHPRHARTEEILQVAIQAIESAQQQNVA